MQPAVHMVCEIDQELIESYPLDELPWKPNPYGVCGMIRNPPRMREFFELVEEHFKGAELGFNMVSKVIPKQVIPLHTDQHDHDCKTRVHIPLITDPHAYFYTGGEFFHMGVGKVYVIDPSREHGVANLGTSERVHLIFNVVQ